VTPFNIPNLITLSRILIIPFIVGVFYFPDDLISFSGKNIIATAIFIFAAVTDWLDGYLARKLNQMSAFGAFLDPVADKLFVVGALIVLLFLGRVLLNDVFSIGALPIAEVLAFALVYTVLPGSFAARVLSGLGALILVLLLVLAVGVTIASVIRKGTPDPRPLLEDLYKQYLQK